MEVAFEMAGVVLTRRLLSICQYGWEVHPMDHFFFLDDGNRSSSGKQPFPCFASVCGTAVTICLTLAGSKRVDGEIHCSVKLQQVLPSGKDR